MSLGIVIKGTEGLVLAAESRVTLTIQNQVNGVTQLIPVYFDNATKLLSFSPPNTYVGAVTFGQAVVGTTKRTAQSFVPEFEARLTDERLPVNEFANRLSAFYKEQWDQVAPSNYKGGDMTFVVGGFDEDNPYGRVFTFDIPGKPIPVEQNPNSEEFGITWGGQREIVDRLMNGFDPRLGDVLKQVLNIDDAQIINILTTLANMTRLPVPVDVMALQDCVDLAILFIATTINAQKLSVGIRGCGGAIDVATITRREGLKFVQRKSIVGQIGGLDDVK